jgi:hypothetical protein
MTNTYHISSLSSLANSLVYVLFANRLLWKAAQPTLTIANIEKRQTNNYCYDTGIPPFSSILIVIMP